MRRTIITLALAVAGVTAATAPAVADTENCVSLAEFDNTRHGESPVEVAQRFDVYGFIIEDEGANFRRGYRACWAPGVRQAVVVFSYDTGGAVNHYVRDAP